LAPADLGLLWRIHVDGTDVTTVADELDVCERTVRNRRAAAVRERVDSWPRRATGVTQPLVVEVVDAGPSSWPSAVPWCPSAASSG
jgi:hypothetical protein